ncbi:MAG: Rpn family recombination-promoting nuclease/putative transposase, partial [Bacteroidota bacterium]
MALIILYHGKESPYPYPLHPEECYACPELAMPYFSFKLNVVDLNTLSDETILKGGICAPLLLLLKHGRDGIFELEPQAYRAAFKACIESVGEDYIETMLDYAQSLSSREAGKRVFHFIAEVLNDNKD